MFGFLFLLLYAFLCEEQIKYLAKKARLMEQLTEVYNLQEIEKN